MQATGLAVKSLPKLLSFPPEITYVILEHLGTPKANQETIKALCLTARDFWNPCQRTLFTTVDIVTTWSDTDFQSPASRLLAVLKATGLGTFTRHLTCCCAWNETDDCPENIREHILSELFPLFDDLRTVSIDFPGLVQRSPDIVHCKLPARDVAHILKPILQQRSLVQVSLKCIPADVLLHCSPSVTRMALGSVFPSLLLYPFACSNNGPTKWQVESLYLDSGYCLNWLESLPNQQLAHLRKLSIVTFDCLNDCKSHRTSRFLESCASLPKLEVLSLQVAPCKYVCNLPVYHRPRISNFESLRVLHLTFEGYTGWYNRLVEPRSFLRPFFADISPTNVIETIIISCTYNENDGRFQPSWSSVLALGTILIKDQFPSLREVVFYARGADLYAGQGLALCLAALSKRGISSKILSGSHDEWMRMVEEA